MYHTYTFGTPTNRNTNAHHNLQAHGNWLNFVYAVCTVGSYLGCGTLLPAAHLDRPHGGCVLLRYGWDGRPGHHWILRQGNRGNTSKKTKRLRTVLYIIWPSSWSCFTIHTIWTLFRSSFLLDTIRQLNGNGSAGALIKPLGRSLPEILSALAPEQTKSSHGHGRLEPMKERFVPVPNRKESRASSVSEKT